MDRTSKQDLRFIKNENLIQNTFREMIAENEYSRISIKELTERALINRKTFYLHFKDKYDLLDAILKEHFEAFRENVRQIPDAKPIDFYREALAMLGRHREFFKRVYNGQASALIRKRIQYYVLQRLQLEYGTDVDPAIQHFIAAGIGGVFESYINGEIEGSDEQIAADMAWMVVQAKKYLKKNSNK